MTEKITEFKVSVDFSGVPSGERPAKAGEGVQAKKEELVSGARQGSPSKGERPPARAAGATTEARPGIFAEKNAIRQRFVGTLRRGSIALSTAFLGATGTEILRFGGELAGLVTATATSAAANVAAAGDVGVGKAGAVAAKGALLAQLGAVATAGAALTIGLSTQAGKISFLRGLLPEPAASLLEPFTDGLKTLGANVIGAQKTVQDAIQLGIGFGAIGQIPQVANVGDLVGDLFKVNKAQAMFQFEFNESLLKSNASAFSRFMKFDQVDAAKAGVESAILESIKGKGVGG